MVVFMGEAEKKQRQFRDKDFRFSIAKYQEKMVSCEYTDEEINFHFALCLLAK